MPKSLPSHATPEILEWARVSAGLSIEGVAAAEKIHPDVLKGWEKGDGSPTFAKLRTLAKRYKRPLMVFYLAELPTEFDVVKDYRTLPSDFLTKFSPELVTSIRFAQERQAWAASYLEETREPEILIVDGGKDIQDPTELAFKLRDALGVSLESQSNCTTDPQAFNLWKNACESLGVFVFQVSSVSVEEMRGFALPNPFAPSVALNSGDSYTARTFTLIHELSHLIRNESGVTGAGLNLFSPKPNFSSEAFCNQVAAEVLVPAHDFCARVPKDWQSSEDEAIKKLAKYYRVSPAVIALRLVELDFASRTLLDRKLKLYSKPREQKKSAGGAIPRAQLAEAYNGRLFSRLALSAFYAGEIHGGGLTNLLGLKLKHLPSLEASLFPNRVQLLQDSKST